MGVKCPSLHLLGHDFQFGLNLPSRQCWLQLRTHWEPGALQGRSWKDFSLGAAPRLGGEPLLYFILSTPALACNATHLHPLRHQEGQAGGLMPLGRDTQGSAVMHPQDELVHSNGLNLPEKSLLERDAFQCIQILPENKGWVAAVL